ncbi:MAG: hypothetical protein ABI528_10400, partial [bacterium]
RGSGKGEIKMKQSKLLIIMVILISITSVSLTKALEQNPNKINGDCTECITDPVYLDYFSQAEKGSMLATYQATARLLECYMQKGCFGSTTGYSYEDLLNMYKQNMNTVRELGGEQPYIKLPDSSPKDEENYDDRNNNDNDDGTVRSAY